MIQIIAFDVMDTLLSDPFREALEAGTGRGIEEIRARRDPEAYPALERGEIDEATYWQRHRERGLEVDVAAFHATRRAGTHWLPGMRELLDALEGTVLRVTASNYPVWIEELARGPLAGRLDLVLASHHLGIRKPDLGFYRALLDRLGQPVAAVAFVDDREENVAAARRVGMPAHRFVDAETLRVWLTDLGIPLDGPDRGSARGEQGEESRG
ncbi:MAG: HAD-IA family hydrolase [Nitriliruptoraceae bacterium]